MTAAVKVPPFLLPRTCPSQLTCFFSGALCWRAASLASGMPDALLGRALESVVHLLKQSEGTKGDAVLRSNIQTIAALR